MLRKAVVKCIPFSTIQSYRKVVILPLFSYRFTRFKASSAATHYVPTMLD